MQRDFPSISSQLARIKNGNRESWDSLCKGFEMGLVGKTRLLLRNSTSKNKVTAEDIVQDTLLKAWRKKDTFRGDNTSQFAKWILTILRNQFLDCCGKIDRDVSIVTWFPGGEQENTDKSPSNQIMSLEEEAKLHAALIQLDEKTQRLIHLRNFEGLRFAEIARKTGQNINTITSNYRRALIRLSQLMNGSIHENK
jgi:RNA polymerase sigma-70 factor (ECF subfamily)